MGSSVNGIYVPDVGEGAWGPSVSNNMRRLADRGHNVKAYGAVGDGATDDRAAIQSAITAAEAEVGGRVVFPKGNYIVNSALTLAGSVRLSGASAKTTSITGTFAGPVLSKSTGTNNNVIIEDLRFVNGHNASGTCVSLQGTLAPSAVWRCAFAGRVGLILAPDCFTMMVAECQFSTVPQLADSIGISITNHANIYSCDITAFKKGIYSTAVGFNIMGGRIEVNEIGIEIDGLGTGTITGLTFEGNDYGVRLTSAAGVSVSDLSVFGTAAAPSGQSIVGIDIPGGSYATTLTNVLGRGLHSTALIRTTGTQQNLTLISCNEAGSSAFSSFANITGITTINCATASTQIPNIVRAPVIATGSLPTAGAQQDGRVVIEDAGAGDRNLIIYAGGQRFRIDGGANV